MTEPFYTVHTLDCERTFKMDENVRKIIRAQPFGYLIGLLSRAGDQYSLQHSFMHAILQPRLLMPSQELWRQRGTNYFLQFIRLQNKDGGLLTGFIPDPLDEIEAALAQLLEPSSYHNTRLIISQSLLGLQISSLEKNQYQKQSQSEIMIFGPYEAYQAESLINMIAAINLGLTHKRAGTYNDLAKTRLLEHFRAFYKVMNPDQSIALLTYDRTSRASDPDLSLG